MLNDVKAYEQNRQEKGSEDDLIDQRSAGSETPTIQLLKCQHDLRQNKRIDYRETVRREPNSLFTENNPLIQNEETEQYPEIEEQHAEMSGFVNGAIDQRRLRIVQEVHILLVSFLRGDPL